MKEFTEQWTEKTFTNQDGEQLKVRLNPQDELIDLVFNGEDVFWLPLNKAGDVADAIRSWSDKK